jgi:hypothetical protein
LAYLRSGGRGAVFVAAAHPLLSLPGIILALLLDGVDQTIFQVFTNLPLDGYQSYDKALDIYYLTWPISRPSATGSTSSPSRSAASCSTTGWWAWCCSR